MSKFINTIFISVVVMSFAFVIFKYHNCLNDNEKKIDSLKILNKELSNKNKQLKNYWVHQNQIVPNSVIKNIDIKNKKIIVACFFKNNCGVCMKRMIIDIVEFKKRTKFKDILLIGDMRENDFYTKMQLNNNKLKYLFLAELSSIKESYKSYPFIFIINNQQISHLFIPDLSDEYNEVYFYEILKNLVSDNEY